MIYLKVKGISFSWNNWVRKIAFFCNRRHASCRKNQFTLGGKTFKTTATQRRQTELHQLRVKGCHKPPDFCLTHELQCLSTHRLRSALREGLFLWGHSPEGPGAWKNWYNIINLLSYFTLTGMFHLTIIRHKTGAKDTLKTWTPVENIPCHKVKTVWKIIATSKS